MKIALPNGAVVMLVGWLICSAPAGGAPAGSTKVTFTVALNLTGLHPAAQTGALDCGAVAQTSDWVASHDALLTDFDSVNRWVLSPAHYLGNEHSVAFPIVNRAYTGSQTFTTTLSATAMTDPATHAAWQPGPSVLMACWLTINGRPAIWDPGPIPLVAAAGNFDRINPLPLIAAVATAAAASTVTASGQLTARGVYFVAGPVVVNATLNTGTPATFSSPTASVNLGANAPVQATAAVPAAEQALRSQLGTPAPSTSSGAPPVASALPPAASTVAGPVIQSLSQNPAKVATNVMISGANFTTTQGQVTMSVPAYQKVGSGANITWVQGMTTLNPTILYWSDTGVLIHMPDVPQAVLDPVGTIIVSNALGESNPISFTFIPYYCRQTSLDAPDEDREASVTGLGGRGDQQYLQGRSLANGWVVDRVILGCGCAADDQACQTAGPGVCAHARITESHEGTPNMAVTVHWWYDAWQRALWSIQESVKGVCYYDPYVPGKMLDSLIDVDVW